MDAPQRLSLRAHLADVRDSSNRLVADLCEPVERLGLSREEHLVLLLLWDTDGMPEPLLHERLRLPVVLVEQALRALQHRALVEREDHADSADVWLTNEGRRARAQAGRGEMQSRLRLLERDLTALRDMLQRALDLADEEVAGFGATAGRA